MCLKLEKDEKHMPLPDSAIDLGRSFLLWPSVGWFGYFGVSVVPLAGHWLYLYLNLRMVDMFNFGTFLGLPWFLGTPQKCLCDLLMDHGWILSILALGREKQEDQKFTVTLSYLVNSG